MDEDNWIAVAKAQAVQLMKDETDLLDKVQQRLAFTDQEFLKFLIVLGKVAAPGVAPRLASIGLKP
jgi:hypothetical protein